MLNTYLISKGLITKRLKIFIIKIIIMNINTDRLEPYKIFNYITSPRKMSYQNWLKSPVMEAADTTDDVYFKKVCFKNGDYYTHKHFILDFYQDLIVIYKHCYLCLWEQNFLKALHLYQH